MKKKRKTKQPSPVNVPRFRSLLTQKGITQKQLAKAASIDSPSVTKLLKGQRRLKISEAIAFSEALDVGFDDICNLFSIDIRGVENQQGRGEGRVRVEGHLNSSLALQKEGLRGSRIAHYPFSGSEVHCARFQTAESEYASWDGALVFYRLSKIKGVDSDTIGKLALVKIAGSDELRLRQVRRGYTTGRYNLSTFGPRVIEEDVLLLEAHPVLWLKL